MAPIKSTVGRSVGKLLNSFRDRDLSLDSSVKTSRILSFSASGGDVNALAPGNGYKYHTYTSTGPATFTISGGLSKNIEILIVAGGGGGGNTLGGGGGAGGLLYGTIPNLGPGTYNVTVGSGGTGATSRTVQGGVGTPSTFNDGSTTHTALGGGGSNSYQTTGPEAGGSGAGGRCSRPGGSATQPSSGPLTGYGSNGGDGAACDNGGGGGGGAGGQGYNNPNANGGVGRQYPAFTGPLIGIPSLAPLSGYFAGGGGGSNSTGTGGLGGGGNGVGGGSTGGNGTTNSGGGGGGGGWSPDSNGGNGGPGIVVIRYAV